jgi:membrane protease YdiL (CAAX protease family)
VQIFAIYFLATGLAALAAPFAFRVLLCLQGLFPPEIVGHILMKPLCKLVDRLRWLPLAIGLFWMWNRARIYETTGRNLKWWLPFFLLGCTLTIAICAIQLFHGEWHWRANFTPGLLTFSLCGALLVAALEEIVFRRLLFDAASLAIGPCIGAILGSLFFAQVHFQTVSTCIPMGNAGVPSLIDGLRAGLALLISKNLQPLPFLSLFLLGLLLCRWTHRLNSIFPAIGFHGGIAFIALLQRRTIAWDMPPAGCANLLNFPLCPVIFLLLCSVPFPHETTRQ